MLRAFEKAWQGKKMPAGTRLGTADLEVLLNTLYIKNFFIFKSVNYRKIIFFF